MLPAFLFAAFALLPVDAGCVDERVDCVELNSVLTYVEGGLWQQEEVRESVKQAIFWSHDDDGNAVVRDWRIDKGQFWFDGNTVSWNEYGKLYRVRFGTLRMTYGWEDPERENLSVLPQEKRVKLGGKP